MSSPSAPSAHTFHNVCKTNGGIEDAETGESVFDGPSAASKAAKAFGLTFPYDPRFNERECRLFLGKGHRLIGRLPWREGDKSPGTRWLVKAKRWSILVGTLASSLPADQLAELDELVRYIVVDGRAWRWFLRHKSGAWIGGWDNSLVANYLAAHGYREPKTIMGHLVKDPHKLTNMPFQPEYPGNREWNYGAAQYTYQPADLKDDEVPHHPHWTMILKHCGKGLDDELASNDWAQRTGITTGAAYLLAWAASMLRKPYEKLPYLFFYGEQNSGKSIYHEALALLMTKGVASADRALTNSGDFNGELSNAVLAYIEERDIARSPGCYARVKDWVTSPVIQIRKMHTDAYPQINTLHFVQCSNDAGACPLFTGDTRISAISVPALATGQEIPKSILLDRLREEAPHFMRTIMELQLPPLEGRLALPPIDTSFKRQQVENNVPEFARAIVEYMADHETVTLTAGQLAEALGPGEWPKTIRSLRTNLEQFAAYFGGHGVTFQISPRRTEKGHTVTIRQAA